MNGQISETLKLLVPQITENDIADFLKICKYRQLKKNEYVIPAGQVPKYFGFVLKGLVRYCYITDQGKDYTKAFLGKSSFISSYTAMRNRTASPFSVQCLTETDIFEINYKQWEQLKDQNEVWNFFLIALLEKGYSIKEKREKDLLFLDAETRYKIFREEFYTVESQIKQHLIASYIGITPIALSRIRKKMGLINLC